MEGAVYNPNSLGPSQEGVCSQSGLFGKVEDPKVHIEEIEAGELGKGAFANIYMWETGSPNSVGLSTDVDSRGTRLCENKLQSSKSLCKLTTERERENCISDALREGDYVRKLLLCTAVKKSMSRWAVPIVQQDTASIKQEHAARKTGERQKC